VSILSGKYRHNKNTWSADGLGGGTSTEETEDTEEDLDLVFLAFLDFLSFPDFLDLRLEEVLEVEAAIGTEPIVPPKGEGVPKIPGGIVSKGKGWLGAS